MAQINTDLQTLITARDNMKTALISKGQNVNNDIRTYAQAISNIDGGGGSGDVKLFETKQQMQNDPNPQEGDLAIVYKESEISITEDTVFSSCTFPSTVTLPQAHTDWTYIQIESTDSSIYIEGQIYLTQTEFMFSIYGDTMYYDIMYTSEDGIEYIRTDSNPSTVDFGVDLKFNVYDTFSNDISYFMTTKVTNYDGLFEYREDTNKDKISFLDIESVSYTVNNDVFSFRFDQSIIDKTVDIEPIKELISGYHIQQLFYSNTTDKIYGVDGSEGGNIKCVILNLQGDVIGIGANTTSEDSFNIYEIDLVNKTITLYETVDKNNATLYYRYYEYNSSHYFTYFVSQFVPTSFSVYSSCDGMYNHLIAGSQDAEYIKTGKGGSYAFTQDTVGVILHPKEAKYWVAPTQLSATSDEVYEKSFYGKNGVEQGALQKTDNLTREELLTKTKILSDIYNVTLDPDITTLYAFFRSRQDLYIVNGLRIPNVTNMSEAFASCNQLNFVSLLNTSNVTTFKKTFYGCSFLTSVALTDNNTAMDTHSLTDTSGMFQNCSRLQNAPYMNTSNVTDMSYMFNGCTNLRGIPDYNTSNVTNMSRMFSGCSTMVYVPELDLSSALDISYMFEGCNKFKTTPVLDTSNVTNMKSMFSNCYNLTDVYVYDTSNVTNMSAMFNACRNLTSVPLLNTSNVTDMNNMFYGCTGLTQIPLFNTSNVTNMKSMFSNCNQITSLPQLDTSNVTDMTYMLNNCTAITSIPSFDTTKLQDTSYMFNGCTGLVMADFTNMDTTNITKMSNMLQRCTNLTTVTNLKTDNATDLSSLFSSCTKLTNINALNTSNVIYMPAMFADCSLIQTAPNLDTSKVTNMQGMFGGCNNLSNVPVYDMTSISQTGMASMFRSTALNNNSLNNVLQMCINATNITNTSYKTLRYIGLSQTQANTCKTLSNYSAFTSAGWTTGY